MRIRGYFFLVLLALAPRFTAATDLQPGIDLIEQASAKSNIFELPSFVMKADIRLDNFGKPVNGAYALVWNGPDQWREEISIPGYSEVQVGAKGVIYSKRNTDYFSYQIFRLRSALGFGTAARDAGFSILGLTATKLSRRFTTRRPGDPKPLASKS
jgi:hypothetical protein